MRVEIRRGWLKFQYLYATVIFESDFIGDRFMGGGRTLCLIKIFLLIISNDLIVDSCWEHKYFKKDKTWKRDFLLILLKILKLNKDAMAKKDSK